MHDTKKAPSELLSRKLRDMLSFHGDKRQTLGKRCLDVRPRGDHTLGKKKFNYYIFLYI